METFDKNLAFEVNDISWIVIGPTKDCMTFIGQYFELEQQFCGQIHDNYSNLDIVFGLIDEFSKGKLDEIKCNIVFPKIDDTNKQIKISVGSSIYTVFLERQTVYETGLFDNSYATIRSCKWLTSEVQELKKELSQVNNKYNELTVIKDKFDLLGVFIDQVVSTNPEDAKKIKDIIGT